MSHVVPGWRSARSGAGTVNSARATTHSGAPAARRGAPATAGVLARTRERLSWSLPLACFVVFIFVAVTYRLPLGTAAAAGAVLSLPLLSRFRFPLPLLIFAAFLVWAAFGFAQSQYPEVTQERLTDLGKTWLIMLVAVNALQTRRQVTMVSIFFLGCYALFPVRGTYFNYFVYRSTIAGRVSWNFIYANSNDLAAFTLVPIALCMGICITRQRRDWVWWAAAAGLVMLPLMIFLTQSRGGIIALALLVVLGLVGYRKLIRGMLALALAAGAVALFAPKSVWTRLSGLQAAAEGTDRLVDVDQEGSADQRYEIWKVAARISADHPITGVGVGTYSRVHAQYAEMAMFKRTARGARDTHSTYMNVLAETGWPGLLMFLAMLITSFVHAEKRRRAIRPVMPREAKQILYLEFGIGCFLVAGVFGTYGHLAFLYIYLALLYATAETSWEAAYATGALASSVRRRSAVLRTA
jgi:O-antigen ligase